MKKQSCLKQYRLLASGPKVQLRFSRLNLLVATLSLAFVVAPLIEAQAQDPKYSPLRVSSISAQVSEVSSTITIIAEGSLRRAQTWQDRDGYHVVVPYATALNSVRSLKGVKVRRLAQSLEILVQNPPGTSVAPQVDDNRLTLFVDGSLDPRSEGAADASRVVSDESSGQAAQASIDPSKAGASSAEPFTSQFPNQPSQSSTKAGPPALQPRPDLRVSQGSEPVVPESQIEMQPQGEGFFASIFSTTGVAIIMVLGVVALLVSYKLRSRKASLKDKTGASQITEEVPLEPEESPSASQPPQGRIPEKKKASPQVAPSANRVGGSHLTVATPDSLYGAYRIDQEVGKLVLGQPHRVDVLSSRAPEDRRAIEASLIKMIASSPDEDERRRASEALEEYGFVARECAALLMSPDPFDRTTAARCLGEIKSPAALPFLLEGLYDPESIVRNQAVASIGELKVPRAIGALLDMARRHPDVPGVLISQALSACSVEGLDFFDSAIPEPAMLSDGLSQGFGFDLSELEPAPTVKELPNDLDDEAFTATLLATSSEDVGERLEAAKNLARFEVEKAVCALIDLARSDSEAAIRSQAVSSLAAINHESVFPAVLIGMADESREVRAAAARSLTHLSFERTDAYIRVLETQDQDLQIAVAKACIKSGIVSQAIDRLATGDRRQCYETFAIISLLAKADQIEPVVDAVVNHPNLDVKLTIVRLLTNTGQPEVFEQLRQLAVKQNLPEELRTVLLESMYQLDHSSNPVQSDEQVPQFTSNDESVFETTAHPYDDGALSSETPPGIESHLSEFEP